MWIFDPQFPGKIISHRDFSDLLRDHLKLFKWCMAARTAYSVLCERHDAHRSMIPSNTGKGLRIVQSSRVP